MRSASLLVAVLAFAACAHTDTPNPCKARLRFEPRDCWSMTAVPERLVSADLPDETEGRLSGDEIEGVRWINASGLRNCAAATGFVGFKPSGPVSLRVWVEPDGSAKAVRIVGDDSMAPGYARCLALCVSTWRFAKGDETLRIADFDLSANRSSGPYTTTECKLQGAVIRRGAEAVFTCGAHFAHRDTRLLVHLDGRGNVADARVPADHDPSNEFTRCLKGMLQRRPFDNPSGHDIFWQVQFKGHR